MKGSEQFQTTVLTWLTANKPELLTTEGKTIEECIKYILIKVQKSGCNGFADDEVYAMAVEYYTTANVIVGDAPNASVVVNHHVDKPAVKVDAPAKKDAKKKPITEQGSLF